MPSMGRTFKYYPSTAFLPSIANYSLLITNCLPVRQYLFLALAIIFEVAWAVLLKYTDGFTRLWPTVATLATYLAALYFLNLTVQTMPVGIAYAVWAGTGMVLIALFGVVVLKQHLDIPAIIGLALIVAGVLVLNLGSKSVTH